VDPNSLRYAAATGTVLIRWGCERLPTVWTVPAPDIEPRDARLELARRYLHVYGPHDARGPRPVGRYRPTARGGCVRGPRPVAYAGADTDRRRVDLDEGRADRQRGSGTHGIRSPAAERRRLPPASGSRSRAPGPERGPAELALDAPSLARGGPDRGRDRRHVAARGPDDDRRDLATALARRGRRRRGGSRVAPAAGAPGTDRRPLGRIVVRWNGPAAR
jgi:hypothetical protein